jgi:hypothetical protein
MTADPYTVAASIRTIDAATLTPEQMHALCCALANLAMNAGRVQPARRVFLEACYSLDSAALVIDGEIK